MAKVYIEKKLRKYIEKMSIGDKIVTKKRVITKTDVELFAVNTGAAEPMFLSKEHAESMGWDGQLAPGLLVYSIAVGLMIQSGFIANVKAYMGTDNMRFIGPIYVNDTITVEAEVLSKKKVKNEDWICSYKWEIKNQNGNTTAEGINT